ncbi:MAG TPA: DUF3987 domain-containing protein [bacterium]|nr:DUF3987 domain-containing protein [bacterium]
MSYNNIPHEMRLFKQWIVWKYEDTGRLKPDKIPYIVNGGGKKASVSNPKTWVAFDDAVAFLETNYNVYNGLGFVLTYNDPYVFIDLDDASSNKQFQATQIQIDKACKTYSELSPSGKGLHIIGIGGVPSGRKKSYVEIYSSGRFMTMTGNVYRSMPIRDISEQCEWIWSQMGAQTNAGQNVNAPETKPDTEIIAAAADSKVETNAQKFLDLYNGKWQNYYNSQSEADLSLIDIISFYTQNRIQIMRIFRNSALGKRDKANRNKYVADMITKSFDNQVMPVDVQGLAEACNTAVLKARHNNKVEPEQTTVHGIDISSLPAPTMPKQEPKQEGRHSFRTLQSLTDPKSPTYVMGGTHPAYLEQVCPGLVGRIANFIYNQAVLPVPEAAIAASFAFMTAFTQRAYTVSGTGLNQYILLLMPTGMGKEAMASGIDKLIYACKQHTPMITDYFGPSTIASGQALQRKLVEQPSFLSILGEVDKTIIQLSLKEGNSHKIELRKLMLDLYNKSGPMRTLRDMIRADKKNDIEDCQSPTFSILGEGVPSRLYEALNEGMIEEGLLPRFTMFEYKGKRQNRNENAHLIHPDPSLVADICHIVEYCHKANLDNKHIHINFTDDARTLLRDVERYVQQQINDDYAHTTVKDLWNRAHLKMCKLASIIAIGLNPYVPTIDLIAADYARQIVLNDTINLIKKFERGEIGTPANEIAQINIAVEAIKYFLTTDYNTISMSYGVKSKMIGDKVMPKSFLTRKLTSHKAFKNDRMGPNIAIKRVIGALVDMHIVIPINRVQCSKDYGLATESYAIANPTEVLNGQIRLG